MSTAVRAALLEASYKGDAIMADCEIDPDAPITTMEKIALGAFVLWPFLTALAISALCDG